MSLPNQTLQSLCTVRPSHNLALSTSADTIQQGSNQAPPRACLAPPAARTASPTHRSEPLPWAPQPAQLFCTRAPLLRHLPSRTRRQFTEVLASEWWTCRRARAERAKERALLRALTLPACILVSSPKPDTAMPRTKRSRRVNSYARDC